MDKSINLPLDAGEKQQFIVNFFDVLDKANKDNKRKLNRDDYIKIFGSEELFKIYNPDLEATSGDNSKAGDNLFKTN